MENKIRGQSHPVGTSNLTNVHVSVNISADLITSPEGNDLPAACHLGVTRQEQASYLWVKSRIKPVFICLYWSLVFMWMWRQKRPLRHLPVRWHELLPFVSDVDIRRKMQRSSSKLESGIIITTLLSENHVANLLKHPYTWKTQSAGRLSTCSARHATIETDIWMSEQCDKLKSFILWGGKREHFLILSPLLWF